MNSNGACCADSAYFCTAGQAMRDDEHRTERGYREALQRTDADPFTDAARTNAAWLAFMRARKALDQHLGMLP